MFLLAPRLAFLRPLELEEGSCFIWVITRKGQNPKASPALSPG